MIGKAVRYGNKGKNWFFRTFSVGALMLFGGLCFASGNNVYVINNNAPNYEMGAYGRHNGAMCTEYGGICASGRYIMTTRRVRYAVPQWKRPTIRERRLSEGKGRIPYAYRQVYYR